MKDDRQLIAMMAAVIHAGYSAEGGSAEALADSAVSDAELILREIDARAAARREPPETYEQRLARADATAKRVVDQLNAQQP